jgi:hypothetical protein
MKHPEFISQYHDNNICTITVKQVTFSNEKELTVNLQNLLWFIFPKNKNEKTMCECPLIPNHITFVIITDLNKHLKAWGPW